LSRYINSPQVELQVATISVIDFHPLCVKRRSATAVRRLDFPAQRGTDPFRIVAMAPPDHERGRIELLDRHPEDDTFVVGAEGDVAADRVVGVAVGGPPRNKSGGRRDRGVDLLRRRLDRYQMPDLGHVASFVGWSSRTPARSGRRA
jgi:hypothetical protein